MLSTTRLLLVFSLLMLLKLNFALGQEVGKDASDKTQIVTASITKDGVRIAAPSAVVKLRLEVYDAAGQKLFDTEQRGGNVLDWPLQGNAGQHVVDGTYLCVVTVNDPSGRQSKKLGLVTVNAQSATIRAASAADLSLPQAQVVGPIKGEDAELAVVPAEDAPPVTVLAHTGDEAQVARSRGALSFRVGDFFSGNDKEQMRLTEEGNLGIGTAKPKATLDVAGTISAREGFVFSDGSKLNVNDKGSLSLTNADGGVTPNIAGTGTQNKLAKWADSSGTMGDSIISETSGALQLTAPVSSTVDTNVMYLDSTSKTTGIIAGSSPNFAAGNGPYFAMRGNNYTAIGAGSQRGLFAISAGDVPGATGRQGSILFNTGPDQVRMTVKPTGEVGIGTETPGARLDVAGNIKLSGSGNSLIFPDGSRMTTAGAGGGTPSGTSIVSAINDPATTGAINDNRLSPNVARLNSANTFTGNQTVNGDVAVNGTLNATALNLNGTQSFPGWITGGSLQVNNANIRTLNADGATLWVEPSNHRVGVHTVVPQYDLDVRGSLAASSVVTGFLTFSDGSGQGTASPISKIYTTAPAGADIEIGPRDANGSPTFVPVLQLNLPFGTYSYPVTYLVEGTVQFENTANLLFQNNTRLVTCKIGNESWSFRLGASGSPMDRLPISVQAVVTLQQYVNEGPVKLNCGASDGGTDRSYVFARGRRLTATKLEALTTQ